MGLSTTGGKNSIGCYGVQQSKEVVRVLEEGTPLAAAPSSKTGSLVLFSTIWSVIDSRSRGETVYEPTIQPWFLAWPRSRLESDLLSNIDRYVQGSTEVPYSHTDVNVDIEDSLHKVNF